MKQMILAISLILAMLLTGCNVSEDIFDKNPKVEISDIEFVDAQTQSVSLKVDVNFIQNDDLSFVDEDRAITYEANFSKDFENYMTYLLEEELGNSRIFDGMGEFSLLSTHRGTEVIELTNSNGEALVYELLFMSLEDSEVAIIATDLSDGVLAIKAYYNDKSQQSIVTSYLEEMLKTAIPLQNIVKFQDMEKDKHELNGVTFSMPKSFSIEDDLIYTSSVTDARYLIQTYHGLTAKGSELSFKELLEHTKSDENFKDFSFKFTEGEFHQPFITDEGVELDYQVLTTHYNDQRYGEDMIVANFIHETGAVQILGSSGSDADLGIIEANIMEIAKSLSFSENGIEIVQVNENILPMTIIKTFMPLLPTTI